MTVENTKSVITCGSLKTAGMASIAWIPVILSMATFYLYGVLHYLPKLNDEDRHSLKFPTRLEHISTLSHVLIHYKETHFVHVAVLFCSAYLYKQTFAIPGSLFMNILAGALLGVTYGFPVVCLLSACGATFCFLLSHFFGKAFITRHFPHKVNSLQSKVQDADGLFFFLLSARIIPMTPNWLLNMISPLANVPVHLFFLSVLLGFAGVALVALVLGLLLKKCKSRTQSHAAHSH